MTIFLKLFYNRVSNIRKIKRKKNEKFLWEILIVFFSNISKSGNHGETFAHSDIAFEFASWLSPEFKRLKRDELYEYKNVALFGMTAKQWRTQIVN